ncbi:Aspartyl-tRNA(Asn) amidotransferase subunit B @ Glutamyl-tRNA(Gln) amidotransferase subunit B [hydrothermal vent metagenome]|uniref:Aspartyl-tRNA(Asn) amidotransferase subunit B @ Glutamyl-tRNA(Gln) amidotransferase subunit B n=1 Tax=hydrothermal vent metagenome TaxID=652676 RepID=A0A3B1BQV2_9ZZZZ
MEYETVIGLEVHVQLSTQSKIFCSCSTQFGRDSNTGTCPICQGMPGVLPVLNKEVVERGIMVGLAMECEITHLSQFARKNYFYPDLPKGYQISQYDKPLCEHGQIMISLNGEEKRIGLTRIHIEEDAGKLIHGENLGDPDSSYVDLNRTGTPLLEIVSEPDLRSSEEAKLYLEKLKTILEYLDVSDCNMEEGSLRCDANISIRPKGSEKLGTRAEIKNMNSFRFLQKAIEFEVKRQIDVVEDGGQVVQETRLYNSDKDITVSMRSKEEAHDYRYFPDPDLTPVIVEKEWVEKTRAQLPELPDAKRLRFMKEYELPSYDAGVLTASRDVAGYFEAVAKNCKNRKTASNWIMGDVLRIVKEQNLAVQNIKVTPAMLSSMINLIETDVISGKIAKTVFEEMANTGKEPATIVEEKGLKQITDTSAIDAEVAKVIADNPKQVEQYKGGKTKVIGFFVGQVMRATKGKASPEMVNKLLKEKLDQ